MAAVTISVRVDKGLYDQMQLHDEINWSGILRKSISNEIEKLESINTKIAEEAFKDIERIMVSGRFSGGKKAEEIIREWRNKRK